MERRTDTYLHNADVLLFKICYASLVGFDEVLQISDLDMVSGHKDDIVTERVYDQVHEKTRSGRFALKTH